MSITRKTFLYEVLIRFGPDGLRGIHAIDMEQIVEGDVVHAETAQPARPVGREDLADLVGEQATNLIEQVTAALAEVEAQRARADAAEQLLAETAHETAAKGAGQ